jgi:hypothetical protein
VLREKPKSQPFNEGNSGTPPQPIVAQGTQVAASPNFLDRLGKLLEIIVGAAAIAAAIGLPAVYVHYTSFGVPTSFVTYDQILRAGILPALLLLLVAWYVYLTIEEYKEGTSKVGAFMVPSMLVAPIPIAAALIFLAGGLANSTWLFWHSLRPIFWALSKFALPVSERIHLYLAIGAGIILFIAGGIETIYEIVMEEQRQHRPMHADPEQVSLPPRAADDDATDVNSQETEFKKLQTKLARWLIAGSVWLIISFMGLAYMLLAVHSVQWYLDQLDVDVAFLTKYQDDLYSIVVGAWLGTLAFIILVSTWHLMRSGNQRLRLLITFVNILMVSSSFATVVWGYSVHLYPQIPPAFGGGRSDLAMVWIAKDDLPADVRGQLRRARCVTIGTVVRCQGVYLFYIGPDIVILADHSKDARNAILIPRAKIKAVSW